MPECGVTECHPAWHKWKKDTEDRIPVCTICGGAGCDEALEYCQGCLFNDPVGGLVWDEIGAGNTRKDRLGFWFCSLCRNSPCGNATMYPMQYEDSNTLRTLNYGFNQLRKDLGAK
jgi:hypothetical protein